MPGITIEWINEKIGAFYVENKLFAEEILKLQIENAELKNKVKEKEPKPEGSEQDGEHLSGADPK